MPNIVAGSFADRQQAEQALRDLAQAGFARDALAAFALDAHGRSAAFPVGDGALADDSVADDAVDDWGPRFAVRAGAGIRVAVIPGALDRFPDDAREGLDPPQRPAGVMVAVHAPQPAEQECALGTLVCAGARSIETADGTWRAGRWVDFDPVAGPEPADQAHPSSGHGP
jgi:hypothetical protein